MSEIRKFNATPEEVKQDILVYYLKNKNNSLPEISEIFGVSKRVVDRVIERSFQKPVTETFLILESKMNHEDE